jgi:hypothetical protein
MRRTYQMKRLNTMLSIAIAAMMISGAFMVLTPLAVAQPAPNIADPEPIDMGYKIREETIDPTLLSQNGHTIAEAVPGDYWIVGNVAKYYTGGYGKTNWMDFTMRAADGMCELWTANDMLFPAGDPRNQYTSRISLTDAQVNYMVGQFNNNIYPIESQYFSTPGPLDGSGSLLEQWGFPESRLYRTHVEGRVMIMVFNIVDANYYDPNYPYYIVGFYSPTNQAYYARNIIHIDIWDWQNRTGPNTPNPRAAYLYESTVAHEYQHLLHNYLDPAEETWINEGCSDYSEMLCGYGVPDSHIAHYLFNPSNALTAWGDQGDINILADYGAAALYIIYMSDHFGGAAFVSALAQNPLVGTAGVTNTLWNLGYWQWTYSMSFKSWRLANMIRSDTPGFGLYNYQSVDLDAIQALTIADYSTGDGFVTRSDFLGPTITMEGFDTGVDTLSAYSVDYYRVTDFDSLLKTNSWFGFDGDNRIFYNNWIIDNVEGVDWWYSQTGIDLADQKLVAPISAEAGTVFEFDAMWELEEFYDFGMVQVSTDNGMNWVSLPYQYTTFEHDPTAHPEIIANLPGVTGFSDGIVHVSLDLSFWAGQDILLSFRYMTDWGTTEAGWWVNDFVLDGEAMPLDMFTPVYENVDFLVSMYFPATDLLPARIVDVPLYKVTEEGIRFLAAFNGYEEAYILVSPNGGPVDYAMGIVSPTDGAA